MSSSTIRYLAPGASSHAVSFPGAVSGPWPSLNERLVEPETPYEMLDGQLITMPCDPAHGSCHSDIHHALRSYVAPGYLVVIDVLTRVNENSDIAPDVSVMREGIDPATGTRYLEELAFEVKHTQKPGQLSRRAVLLSQRGVRRVFGIWARERNGKIEAGPVKEWMPARNEWQELAKDAVIKDPCLRYPLPVRALLDAAALDDAVAQAVVQSEHPAVKHFGEERYQKGEEDGYRKGEKEALQQAILGVCKAFAIELSQEHHAVLKALNPDELLALQGELLMHRRWPEK